MVKLKAQGAEVLGVHSSFQGCLNHNLQCALAGAQQVECHWRVAKLIRG